MCGRRAGGPTPSTASGARTAVGRQARHGLRRAGHLRRRGQCYHRRCQGSKTRAASCRLWYARGSTWPLSQGAGSNADQGSDCGGQASSQSGIAGRGYRGGACRGCPGGSKSGQRHRSLRRSLGSVVNSAAVECTLRLAPPELPHGSLRAQLPSCTCSRWAVLLAVWLTDPLRSDDRQRTRTDGALRRPVACSER